MPVSPFAICFTGSASFLSANSSTASFTYYFIESCSFLKQLVESILKVLRDSMRVLSIRQSSQGRSQRPWPILHQSWPWTAQAWPVPFPWFCPPGRRNLRHLVELALAEQSPHHELGRGRLGLLTRGRVGLICDGQFFLTGWTDWWVVFILKLSWVEKLCLICV